MNFQQFTSRVVASASLAADAARQFNNFDEMAAQDEYIHSPDLNTGRRDSSVRGPPSIKASTDAPTAEIVDDKASNGTPAFDNNTDQSLEGDSSTHTTRSLLDQPPRRQLDFSSQPVDDSESTHSEPIPNDTGSVLFPTLHRQSTMPLMSVVSDIVSEKPRESEITTQCTVNGKDERNENLPTKPDDSDDEDDDDPILDLIRKTPSGGREETSPSVTPPAVTEPALHVVSSHNDVSAEDKPVKNPNRFMEDLDNRLSRPPADIEEGNSSNFPATSNSNDSPSFMKSWGESDNKWEWMRAVASSKLSKVSSQYLTDDDRQERAPLAGPLSRGAQSAQTQSSKDPREYFDVVVSSSMLGTEEQAELDRIRRSTQSGPLSFVLDVALNMAKQHPREVFLAVALILAFVFYFYTRHLANEANAQ